MNRIEKIREVIDEILLKMTDKELQKEAYIHLYGVSQASALLAKKRNENVELAVIAGMLHDVYAYVTMDVIEHAHKGAKMAKEILESLQLFTADEIHLIYKAIYYHSDKEWVHGALDEILKDADVMQHMLYNPLLSVKRQEQERGKALEKEFL